MWHGDADAEKSVIGAMMLNEQALANACRLLSPSDFTEPPHPEIFKAAVHLYHAGIAVDLVTLMDVAPKMQSKDHPWTAVQLTELSRYVPTTVNHMSYIRIVQEKSARRKTAMIAQDLGEGAKDETRDIRRIRLDALNAIAGIRIGDESKEDTSAEAVMLAMMQYAERRANSDDANLTGIADLDIAMGGLQPGQFTILAARPSNGKSTLAWQIGEQFALRGQRVMFVSLEMSHEQIGARWAAMHGVDMERMRHGTMTEQDWEAAAEAAALLSKMPIHVHTTIRKVSELRAAIKAYMDNGGIGLVIVDYLQLLRPERETTQNTNTQVSQISRDLKLLTTEFKIPLLALSQMSRAIEARPQKTPLLSDLRDSGTLEQDADNVIFLVKPKRPEDVLEFDKNVYDEALREGNHLTYCHLSKQRSGPLAEFKLLFRPSRMRMYSMLHDFTPIDDEQTEMGGVEGV